MPIDEVKAKQLSGLANACLEAKDTIAGVQTDAGALALNIPINITNALNAAKDSLVEAASLLHGQAENNLKD